MSFYKERNGNSRIMVVKRNNKYTVLAISTNNTFPA